MNCHTDLLEMIPIFCFREEALYYCIAGELAGRDSLWLPALAQIVHTLFHIWSYYPGQSLRRPGRSVAGIFKNPPLPLQGGKRREWNLQGFSVWVLKPVQPATDKKHIQNTVLLSSQEVIAYQESNQRQYFLVQKIWRARPAIRSVKFQFQQLLRKPSESHSEVHFCSTAKLRCSAASFRSAKHLYGGFKIWYLCTRSINIHVS